MDSDKLVAPAGSPLKQQKDLASATAVSFPSFARVAAALLHPPATSQALDVTSPEPITLAAVAQRLTALVGRPLHYEAETVAAGRAWRSQLDAPAWEVATWLGSYEAIAAGELSAVSQVVN